MTTMVWVYLGYLTVCVVVAMLVARTLRIHGPTFMSGENKSASPLIKAKTHLIVVGFNLITLGLISYALRFGGTAADATTAIELLSTKIGGMVLAIGLMHFLMIAVFASARPPEPAPIRFKKIEPVVAEET